MFYDYSPTVLSMGDSNAENIALRNIMIRKRSCAYGLTLIGDHPVTVQSIARGSPAFEAGLEAGEVIVKVNGVNVWDVPHAEVVLMIKNGLYVTLTVTTPDGNTISKFNGHS